MFVILIVTILLDLLYISKDYKMLTRRLEALSYNDVFLYEGAFLYVQGGRKDVNL